MNKNSTQKGTGKFVSKISAFLTILPAVPAILQRAGDCISVYDSNLSHNRHFFRLVNFSFYIADICGSKILVSYFLKRWQPQLRLQLLTIKQF